MPKFNFKRFKFSYQAALSKDLSEMEDLMEDTELSIENLYSRYDHPYNNSDYQYELLQIYSNTKTKIREYGDHTTKLSAELLNEKEAGGVSEDFFKDVQTDIEVVLNQCLTYQIQIEILHAKYRGAKKIDLNIDLEDRKISMTTMES